MVLIDMTLAQLFFVNITYMNFVCVRALVGAVPYSGTPGFGSIEDDLRRAGVSEGRFECW